MTWYVLLIAAVAVGGWRNSSSPGGTRRGASPAAVSSTAPGTTRSWWCCTRGCCWGASSKWRSWGGRSSGPGLVDAGHCACGTGIALVVHRHAGPSVEHQGCGHPGASRIAKGPYSRIRIRITLRLLPKAWPLPLVHTAWITALVFTVLNAAL